MAPANGPAVALLPPAPDDAELERRRELDRARQRRYRESRRTAAGGPGPNAMPDPLGFPPAAAATSPLHGRGPAAPAHATAPLDSLRRPAESWTDVPIDGVDDLIAQGPPPEPTAGAHKVAALAAWLFAVSLDDAMSRFDVTKLPLPGDVTPENLAKTKEAAVAWAHATVLRTCTKHGIGFTLPYEDELASCAIVGGSALYQWARLTGKLDRLAAAQRDASRDNVTSRDVTPQERSRDLSRDGDASRDDDEDAELEADTEFDSIKLSRNDPSAEVPGWLARK